MVTWQQVVGVMIGAALFVAAPIWMVDPRSIVSYGGLALIVGAAGLCVWGYVRAEREGL